MQQCTNIAHACSATETDWRISKARTHMHTRITSHWSNYTLSAKIYDNGPRIHKTTSQFLPLEISISNSICPLLLGVSFWKSVHLISSKLPPYSQCRTSWDKSSNISSEAFPFLRKLVLKTDYILLWLSDSLDRTPHCVEWLYRSKCYSYYTMWQGSFL